VNSVYLVYLRAVRRREFSAIQSHFAQFNWATSIHLIRYDCPSWRVCIHTTTGHHQWSVDCRHGVISGSPVR